MLQAGSPLWWLIFEVIAVLAIAGWIVVWLMVRSKRRSDEALQRYRAEAARLQLRVQTLEMARTPASSSTTESDYLNDSIFFCEQRLATLTKLDPLFVPLNWRLRALKSEALARETGHWQESALPLVVPAYTPPTGRRAVLSGKEAQLLRDKLHDAELEIARLKTIESLYHDLRAAVSGHANRGLQTTQQLHNDWQARGVNASELSLIEMLQNSFLEMQKLMQKADGHTPLQIPPDLRLALEQGAQLQTTLLNDQESIKTLREQLNLSTDLGDSNEADALRAQLKSQQSQLSEAMMCIDTLENNLAEAHNLLKKLVDRARRYQELESRVAILDARCKQGDKDLRMLAQVNQQLDAHCQQLNQHIDALNKGGDPALQMAQQRFNEKQQEMERLSSERAMLEEQVIELDQWRDRADSAESQLKRALIEKQMLEDYFAAHLYVDDDAPANTALD